MFRSGRNSNLPGRTAGERCFGGPMANVSNTTPLIAIDAFVIDTETTGLDPARARIVEIGAVPLRKGKLDQSASLRRLINPGEPIPPEATRIHAIDDSMVASAPDFAAVWQDISAAISGEILIGHTFGFDLAVLKRECQRGGLLFFDDDRVAVQSLHALQIKGPVARLAKRSNSNPVAWIHIERFSHSALLSPRDSRRAERAPYRSCR